MDERTLKRLLRQHREGRLTEAELVARLRSLPFEDLGHAKVDHHRALRCGHPEVIYGEGKSPGQVLEIARALRRRGSLVLVTRAAGDVAAALTGAFADALPHEEARAVTVGRLPRGVGRVAVVSAGTSDRPVAAEAALTARCCGARVDLVEDVGVAGIHRLLAVRERLQSARAIVVVAGMEGALPSVVGGLVSAPVIAVPTSVGYGASFGGVAALLGMLTSCASGVSVVNIDNGFGAGYQAALINRR
jgi:NCAIR mutase (PurE)-related protein